jgi:hypothetical protein
MLTHHWFILIFSLWKAINTTSLFERLMCIHELVHLAYRATLSLPVNKIFEQIIQGVLYW